jgi:hypothetical protein
MVILTVHTDVQTCVVYVTASPANEESETKINVEL